MKVSFPLPELGRVFSRKKTGLALYITDKVFRLLELTGERKPTFEPVEQVFREGSNAQRISELREVVEQLGLKGKEVISCLTVDEGILKLQRFPASMPKKDLMEAIDWYIKSETQQIKEETIYDYYFLEKEPEDKYIKVIVTIARRSSVERLKETVSGLGLKPKIIDYEVVTIINFGLVQKLPIPFAILYVDYHESLLVYFSKTSLNYNKIDFDFLSYKESKDEMLFDSFLIEARNMLVLNEISNIYLAGPIISDEDSLEKIMVNLPVLGILDIEDVPPSFFVPYTLAVRVLED